MSTSIAAEIAVPDKEELLSSVEDSGSKLLFYLENLLKRNRVYLESFPKNLEKFIVDLDLFRMKIDDCLNAIVKQFDHEFEIKKTKTQAIVERLNSLNPNAVLKRGFAIVQNKKNDNIVQNLNDIEPGDLVNVTLNKGNFEAEVLPDKKNRNID